MSMPDKDGWIAHTPGECPVPQDAMVEARRRSIYTLNGPIPAKCLDLGARDDGAEIARYRVWEPVKPAEAKPEPEAPTLRDQFAMHALTGLLASLNGTDNWEVPGKEAALYAYEFADAMLAARKGGE